MSIEAESPEELSDLVSDLANRLGPVRVQALEPPEPEQPNLDLPPTPGVDSDPDGLPWDERIHSTPPQFKKDGHWRARRGVTAAVVAQVKAELYGSVPTPTAITTGTPVETGTGPLDNAIDLASQILSAHNVPSTGSAIEQILINSGVPADVGIPGLMNQPEKAPAVLFGLLQLAQTLGVPTGQ